MAPEQKKLLDGIFKSPSLGGEDFPKLNPSQGLPMPTSTAPMMAPNPVTQPSVQEPQSFLGKIGQNLIGGVKQIGSTLLGNAKMAADQAPKAIANSIIPGAGMAAPSLQQLPGVKQGFERAEATLQPSNETQQHAKDATALAELFVPFIGGATKYVTRLPDIARNLEKTSMRLTASEKRDLGDKVNRAADLLVKEGIAGSPASRVDKIDKLYEDTEAGIEKFLKSPEVTGVTVNRDAYLQELENLKIQYANKRDAIAIAKQIDDAKGNFMHNYGKLEEIPIARFNAWKRSVFGDAFNNKGTKVLDEVEFAIGDKAKTQLETALVGRKIDDMSWEDYNRRYGDIINARKILKGAENKDQLDMWPKIVSTILGTGIGGALGGAGGFAAGGGLGAGIAAPVGATIGASVTHKIAPVVAGTAMRTNVAQLADSIGTLAPAARKMLGTLLLGGEIVTADRLQEVLSSEESSQTSQQEQLPQPSQPQLSLEQEESLDSLFKK